MSSCGNKVSGCLMGNSDSSTERRSETVGSASQVTLDQETPSFGDCWSRQLAWRQGATFILWQPQVFRSKEWKESKLWMIVFGSLKPTTHWSSPGYLISRATKSLSVFAIPSMFSRHLRHSSIPCVIRNSLSLATQRTSPFGGTGGWDSMRTLMLNILKLCWKNALNLKCQINIVGYENLVNDAKKK